MNSVILKNALVIDPYEGSCAKRDLAWRGRKMADPADCPDAAVIDAEGCLVVPGLIDYHIHVAQSSSDGAVSPDLIALPNGVTTVVDGGTCGISNFEAFYRTEVVHSVTRVKSYLNVSPPGLVTSLYTENADPKYYQPERMQELFEKYPEVLTAVKCRVSRNVVESSGLTREPFDAARKIAEQIGCPLVVHVNDPIFPLVDVADGLRKGDVFCHMYQGMNDTIIGEDGHVRDAYWAARERGVLFDACNGRSNFTFKVAIPAIADGFLPDIVSTDISPMTQYEQPAVSLPNLMSKYLALGLTVEQIIPMVTLHPARQLGMEKELGSLLPGTVADLAVFRLEQKPCRFWDYLGESVDGTELFVPQMTVKDGKTVYRQVTF